VSLSPGPYATLIYGNQEVTEWYFRSKVGHKVRVSWEISGKITSNLCSLYQGHINSSRPENT